MYNIVKHAKELGLEGIDTTIYEHNGKVCGVIIAIPDGAGTPSGANIRIRAGRRTVYCTQSYQLREIAVRIGGVR